MRKPSVSIRKLAVLAAVTAAAAIAASLALSSSHREAPNIMLDPSADNTDVYAWTAPRTPSTRSRWPPNWIPGQVPANGPNFFRFDDRARYYIHFDNTGDGVADIKYLFKFNTRLRNPNSFLYAGPGTMGFGDPGLNVIQRYDVTRLKYKHGKLKARKVVAEDLPVAPPNIGPKTFPDYDNFVDAATRKLPGGGKIFVGQRDDPFYVDLGATFDAINVREGTGNEGEGKDDFSGYSTSAIVLQLPEGKVTKDGEQVAGAGRQERGRGRLVDHRPAPAPGHERHARPGSQHKARPRRNRFVQVSRLGNPLVNEVVIPLGKKDQFNRTTPDEDAARYGKFVLKPELAAILNALFGVGAPETDRTDIVQALLQGIPGLNQHSGKNAGDAGGHPEAQPGRAAQRAPGPVRSDRRRQRRLPERPAAGGRRGRHRAPGGRRIPGRQPGGARRRGGQERQAVPVRVPVPGRSGLGVRLESLRPVRASRTRRFPPAAGPEPEGELRSRSGRSAAPAALRPRSRLTHRTKPLKGRGSEISGRSPQSFLFKWATPALAFAAVLAVLVLVNRSGVRAAPGRPGLHRPGRPADPRDTESLIASAPGRREGGPGGRERLRAARRRLLPAGARDRGSGLLLARRAARSTRRSAATRTISPRRSARQPWPLPATTSEAGLGLAQRARRLGPGPRSPLRRCSPMPR